ncbi:hemerythrin domain-containing protein [Uliginosibacterium paludis]|uniref:Hemerythrin domain-containing protein n=1 Tax=Uliginosibacterium paludis TaxID=1615952 RepID=A0ABV2CT51_9RHOO
MPSSRTSSTATPSSSRSTSRAASTARTAIIDLLREDHKRAKKAFRDFEKLDPQEDADECQAVVTRTCGELRVHTALEEELLYPALHEVLKEEDLVDEAEVEHMSARRLIDQLTDMGPEDDKFVATFRVLGEYVKHHIREEESEIFPQMQRAKYDWQSMQQEMERRRVDLMAEHLPDQPEDGEEVDDADDVDEADEADQADGAGRGGMMDDESRDDEAGIDEASRTERVSKTDRQREKKAAEEQDSLPEG